MDEEEGGREGKWAEKGERMAGQWLKSSAPKNGDSII